MNTLGHVWMVTPCLGKTGSKYFWFNSIWKSAISFLNSDTNGIGSFWRPQSSFQKSWCSSVSRNKLSNHHEHRKWFRNSWCKRESCPLTWPCHSQPHGHLHKWLSHVWTAFPSFWENFGKKWISSAFFLTIWHIATFRPNVHQTTPCCQSPNYCSWLAPLPMYVCQDDCQSSG